MFDLLNLVYSSIVLFLVLLVIINFSIIICCSIYVIFNKVKYPPYFPDVSIIIPARNEEKNIAKCLKSILKSNYPKRKLELICVDDASTDKTSDIIKKFQNKDKRIILLKGLHQGQAAALNVAYKAAKNEIILGIDADTEIAPDYITKIVAPFQNPKIGLATGSIMIKPKNNLIASYQQIEYFYWNLNRQVFTKCTGFAYWFCGQSICYRKKVLDKIGGFNNRTLTEDFDTVLSTYIKGYQSAAIFDAYAYTEPLTSSRFLINQRMRWFFGIMQNLLVYKNQFTLKSPVIVYVYFSYLLWFLSSIFFFPSYIYILINYIIFKPVEIIFFLFRSTIIGPFLSLPSIYSFNFFSGIMLALLISVSTYLYVKKVNLKLLFTILTYSFYIKFLQLSVICSFFKYGIRSNLRHIR